jgi:uncharacterized membrane protein YdjX (TVP38/TMEM64 family)
VRKAPQGIPWKWVGLGIAAVGLVVSARLVPLHDLFHTFDSKIEGMGPLGALLFGLVYVASCLLFVPGSVMTIGAGLVFGLGWGIVVVSPASTTTAAIAFLIARYLARDRVEGMARRHERFAAIDRAIRDKGWRVVALLRLSPLVPFNLSNYLYGLTAVEFGPYVFASWLGMLPGTALYVYLGVAGKAAASREGRTPWEWALLGAGLAATAAVTVILTHAARREMEKGDGGRKR